MKKPKSELTEFYQLHIGKPKFEVQSGPPPPLGPRFLCTLTIPSVGCAKGSYPEQVWRVLRECILTQSAEHSADLANRRLSSLQRDKPHQ